MSRFTAVWYPTVVLGWLTFGYALFGGIRGLTHVGRWPELAMCAVLLVALELLPLVQGSGHDPEGVVMSTAFVCALMFLWGPAPAIVSVCLGVLVSDLRAGKSWWKWAFNVGQYALSVLAGYLVMLAAGVHPSLDHPRWAIQPSDLIWMIGVWAAYYLVNLFVVIGVTSYGSSFIKGLLDDLGHYTVMSFAVLAISPVIVALAVSAWWLLPVLLIPLLLLYFIAQLSLAREHDALHDPLTSLANRAGFDTSLADGLEEHRDRRLSFGLMLIDLDHFKEVNDTLGHNAGDALLKEFAARLRDSVREEDEVARLGGDEFAVLLPGADETTAAVVAQRIREALQQPFLINEIYLDVEASIGLAIFPDQASDATDLLRLADVAMYDAKNNRLGVATYQPHRDPNDAGKLSLLSDLRLALLRHELTLHYQPKVSLADGALIGFEALIRWEHPHRGSVPPDEFIPLAERSGLMPMLTESVVGMALSQITRWHKVGVDVPVAVNVTLPDIVNGNLDRMIDQALNDTGIPRGALQVEITERVMSQYNDQVNKAMRRLQGHGLSFSLDDFGTGYSSLLRLQALPVDELKIDRVFISTLTTEPSAHGIVKSTIELAHALGIPAIAEGVETAEEWQLLCDLGCDGAQGWYIARAMPAEVATAWAMARICPAAVESSALAG